MSILDKTIVEIHEALIKKEVKVSDLVKESLERIKNDKFNAFEFINEEDALKEAYKLDKEEVPQDNLFFGIPYVAKDNFSTKDIESTGGSNILKGYYPVFDAEVIRILKEHKAVMVAKSTLDELAMGGSGTSGHKGTQYNPFDDSLNHRVGGSSSGSAIAISAPYVPFALGSDTGDSVRKPASNVGAVGFKPTYGLISRFGLYPFAVSLDHVAYFTRSVEDAAISFDLLNKYDEKDYTSSLKSRNSVLPLEKKTHKIALIKEICDSITDPKINEEFNKLVNKLKEEGNQIEVVSVDEKILKAIYPAYIIISSAEATSNNANLDGIKFGNRKEGKTYQEVMFNTRNEGFGELIKRRFVLGSFALMRENQEDTYLRAKKVRHLIVNKFDEILKEYDAFIAPASPSTAPKVVSGDADRLNNEYLIADNFLGIGNFGGYPSITIPLGVKDNLPFGLNITSLQFEDKKCLEIAKDCEDIIGMKNFSVLSLKEAK